MEFTITKGIVNGAKKLVLYGPEGIGKSTFAAAMPDPLFIDTEGSTKNLDVARLPKPESWEMLLEEIRYVASTPGLCRTLVIDTMDWTEALCIESICARSMKNGIEDFGYGKGYVYVAEEIGRFLKLLDQVIHAGVHVCLTAHAMIRKFEQPDEAGAYDRYELKLGQKTGSKTAALIKEWSDLLLFANYKTIVVGEGEGKRKRAQGGRRVMYTSHHPCWDAKNRFNLPEEMDFDYRAVVHIFVDAAPAPAPDADGALLDAVDLEAEFHAPCQTDVAKKLSDSNAEPGSANRAPVKGFAFESIAGRGSQSAQIALNKSRAQSSARQAAVGAEPISALWEKEQTGETGANEDAQMAMELVDPELARLMARDGVTEAEIQNVVADRGYYPRGTPLEKYDHAFIKNVLVIAWEEVRSAIWQKREKEPMPWEANNQKGDGCNE